MVTDFIATVKKINEALTKQADWPKTSGWLQLINGGRGPEFVLLSSRKNYADMAPLPKTVADVLNKVCPVKKLPINCRGDCVIARIKYLRDLEYHGQPDYSPEK